MLNFLLYQELHDFVDAISILAETFNDTLELKFSPSRFSIMAATSPLSRCVLALQLSPDFFTVYSCNKLEYKLVYIPYFYDSMSNLLQRNGFSSLAFGYSDQVAGYQARTAVRIFLNGNYERNDIPLCSSIGRLDDVGEFDCATFVSIESQEFINIITVFHNFDNVLVTISSSQVKFSKGNTTIILTQEGNQCIIGGIEESNQIIFAINHQPTELFCNFIGRSKRVWLFKSINSLRGVIAAPLGLYARYLAYFPFRDDINGNSTYTL